MSAPLPPSSSLPHHLPPRLRQKLRMAIDRQRQSLLLSSFRRFLFSTTTLVALVQSGALPRLGAVLHTVVLVSFVALIAYSFKQWRTEARRLNLGTLLHATEQASALPHRPLSALIDKPVTASPLWISYQARLTAMLETATFKTSQKTAMMTAFVCAAIISGTALQAGDNWATRWQAGLRPALSSLFDVVTVEAWVTPPAYTGKAAETLSAQASAASLLQGSVLTLRVHGGWFNPIVRLDGQGRYRLQRDGETANNYSLTLPLNNVEAPASLILRQDSRTLFQTTIKTADDHPPSVTFSEPPVPNRQAVMRFSYKASDDVGLAAVDVVIEGNTDKSAQSLRLPLPLATSPVPLSAESFRYFDLTAHPLAGHPVTIWLEARDQKGQKGKSAPLVVALPERVFQNPIAKAIITARRSLIDQGLSMRVSVMVNMIDLMGTVQQERPQDWLGALILNAVAGRLQYNRNESVITDVLPLMWSAALHFEDHGSLSALEALRQAQQNLEDALNRNAGEVEIAQLMSAFEEALQNYIDTVENTPSQDSDSAENQDRPQRRLNREELQNYLNELRERAQSGDKEAARQMLQNLTELMENLRAAQNSTGDAETDKRLQQLESIARDQQEQMAKTQAQQGDASAQEALRQRLGQVMQEMADEGEEQLSTLGKGEQAMRGARQNLQAQQSEKALQQQGEALTHLQNAMGELRQRAEEKQEGGRDPFGQRRHGGRNDPRDKLTLPNADQADQLRSLRDELRRRAGDLNRSSEERDYLDRLLKLF